jgi:hypothetical protein
MLKILPILFLLSLWSCQESADSYASNIYVDNGKFTIDTKAYVGDGNLEILLRDVKSPDFKTKNSVQDIPVFIKTFLDSLADTFSIANPGEDWKCCCTSPMEMDYSTQKKTVDPKTGDTIYTVSMKEKYVPLRELTYLGIGRNTAVMTYHTGGWGVMEHILIIRFEGEKIVDFRHGNVEKDIATKAAIIQYLEERGWGIYGNLSYL